MSPIADTGQVFFQNNSSVKAKKETNWYLKTVIVGALVVTVSVAVAFIYREKISLLFAEPELQKGTFLGDLSLFMKTPNDLSKEEVACRTLYFNQYCPTLHEKTSNCAPVCGVFDKTSLEDAYFELYSKISDGFRQIQSSFSESAKQAAAQQKLVTKVKNNLFCLLK